VVRSDDKKRARLAAVQRVLAEIDYAGKDSAIARVEDPKICGGPDIWDA
jgi:polyphosphate kinase 2 (PPK2 family)